MRHKFSPLLLAVSGLVLLFLYIPIFLLIAYSFNKSQLVNVWAGFSTKWYGKILHNDRLLDALFTSLEAATTSATLSVILGTLAALAMVRLKKFKGQSLFKVMTLSPLVMPEVITGLALLLSFVFFHQTFGWPSSRGIITITIAHTTLAMAYVTVIVKSRLDNFDMALEEAALDLGAKPLKVFFTITLPIIAPSLICGWLLAFVLSLDDVVIASFVSGPSATTLPMYVFSSIKLGTSPEINVIATLMILVVTLAASLTGFFLYKTQKEG